MGTDTHTHPVGGPLAKKDETKGTKIERSLAGLNAAVAEIEYLVGIITGEDGKPEEALPTSSDRAIGFLLTELPDDLDNLSNRVMSAKTSIRTSLY